MPLRTAPFRAAAAAPLRFPGLATVVHHHHQHHSKHKTPPLSSYFHSTPATRRDEADSKTHYEVLQVQTSAHPADIKKSFYALSKANHPDHNQHDPAAGKRFVRISEAYSVLSSADRRARYDRDVLRLHERPAHGHGHGHGHGHAHGDHHRGSYSSTGPAGGRPASGLSRRRGAFHGPPPSFYRNGGWGAYQAKRGQAHEETTGGGGGNGGARRGADDSQPRQQQWKNNTFYSENGFRKFGGGMGPGQDPLGKGGAAGAGDVPHFDRAAQAAHTRTQARVDEIRRRRMARDSSFPSASDWGESRSFFAVLTVLGIAIGVPYFLTREWTAATAKKKKKNDWSRTATG